MSTSLRFTKRTGHTNSTIIYGCLSRQEFHACWLFGLPLFQDVAWQGNLFTFFEYFSTWRDDLLCDKVRNLTYIPKTGDQFKDGDDGWFAVHSGWANAGVANHSHVKCEMHCKLRSYVLFSHILVVPGMKFVVRYSRRLLDVLVDRYLSHGHWAQDEWFASTVCARQLDATFERRECHVGDYQLARSDTASDPKTMFDEYRFWCCPPPFSESDWHYNISAPPRLYHPMKY